MPEDRATNPKDTETSFGPEPTLSDLASTGFIDAPATPASETSFTISGGRWPAPGWARYRCERLLGEGGAGTVFKAWDTQLNRWAAIKFLKLESAELTTRFTREAQAQAHVEHPHVCKIYEVGTVEGHAYIAMQFVDGEPLKTAYPGMTLEQRVIVMRQVAEAVHAAHRQGIIHRDIKPVNIMLERNRDGVWWPYVVDFGLVREEGADTLTVTGSTLGTPSYMAPEQARGELASVDRRSDVYSLGATLYEVLGRQPPFVGMSAVDVLIHVIHDEPAPLNRLAPRIPNDLNTIVMKCLEKEPARRYDSARAVADDLGRFLDGEPVAARAAGPFYRIGKRIRKHKLLAALGAVAVLAILTLLSLWWYTRSTAAYQAEIAQRFARELEQAESVLWRAQSLPPHDIRPTKQAVRKMLGTIEREMKAFGSLAEGPGYSALGRCYLTLHDYERARAHLERAWTTGYRSPETAYALGVAFSRLYQRELDAAGKIEDKAARSARRALIEKTLRAPAVAFIQMCRGAVIVSGDYLEALLALLEKRYEEAVQKARVAFAQIPWLYEAKQLEGIARRRQAADLLAGGDREGAKGILAQSENAFLEALTIARSDPLLYDDLVGTYVDQMYIQVWLDARLAPELYRKALGCCRQGLTVDASSLSLRKNMLRLYSDFVEYGLQQGQDVIKDIDESIRLSLAAVDLAPDDVELGEGLGLAYWQKGKYLLVRGRYDAARSNLLTALAIVGQSAGRARENAQLQGNEGLICLELATLEVSAGGNPLPYLDRGVSAMGRALAQEPRMVAAWVNRALLRQTRLEYEVAGSLGNPEATAREAFRDLAEAGRISPDLYWIPRTAGMIHATLADHRRKAGHDPLPEVRAADEDYRRALTINPDDQETYRLTVDVWLIGARYSLSHGGSAREELTRAEAALQARGALLPERDPGNLKQRQSVEQVRLEALRRSGRRPKG